MSLSFELRAYFIHRVIDLDWSGIVNKLSSLWRRYSEFELLRTCLEVTYPYIVLPPLPEKKVLYAWQKAASDTFDPDFVDRRRAGLEVRRYITISAFHVYSFDKVLIFFGIQLTFSLIFQVIEHSNCVSVS